MHQASLSGIVLVLGMLATGRAVAQQETLRCDLDRAPLSEVGSDSLVILGRQFRELGQRAGSVVVAAVVATYGSYDGPGPGQFYGSAVRSFELAARFAPLNYWAWHELASTDLQFADQGEGVADSVLVAVAVRIAECARAVALRLGDREKADSAAALLSRARNWRP